MNMPAGLRMNRGKGPGSKANTTPAMRQAEYKPQLPNVAISSNPVNPGADRLLNQVSQSFSNAADQKMKEWQEAVAREQSEAGMEAGLRGKDTEFKEGTHLSAQAFNQSALEMAERKVTADVKTKLFELRQQYATDPVGYQQAAAKLIEETSDPLMQSSASKPLALGLRSQAQTWVANDQALISQNKFKQDSELYRQSTMDTVNSAVIDADRTEGSMFSANPKSKEAALTDYIEGKEQVTKAVTSVDPLTGKPYYSPAEAQEMLRYYDKRFYASQVQGYIPEASSEELMEILDGTFMVDVAGEQIDLKKQLGEKAYQKEVVEYAQNHLKAEQDKAEAQMKQEMQQDEIEKNIRVNNLVNAIKQAPTQFDPNEVDDLYRRRLISESEHQRLKGMIQSGIIEETSSVSMNNFNQVLTKRGQDRARDYLSNNAEAFSTKDYKAAQGMLQKMDDPIVSNEQKMAYNDVRDRVFKRSVADGEYFQDSDKAMASIMTNFNINVANGMDPELAREMATTHADDYVVQAEKDSEKQFFRMYSPYLVFNFDGTVNLGNSEALVNNMLKNKQIEPERAKEIKQILVRRFENRYPDQESKKAAPYIPELYEPDFDVTQDLIEEEDGWFKTFFRSSTQGPLI